MRVLLPAVAGETCIRPEAREPSSPANPAPALHGNVLLVDDNTEVTEFVAELLNEWGLETTVFNDSEAALKHFLARADAYSLAILDQTMPGVTGIKLARLMLQQRPGFPVILYTGHSDSVDDEIARAAGVHTFLRKPLDFAALRSVIETILA